MAKKWLVDLDLNKNELQNAVIQNLASAPANPIMGQHYFNTTDKTEYVFDGTNWVDALNQGKIYTFTTPGLTETSGTVTLDKATTTTIGGVIVGTNISVDNTGTISVADASTTAKGLIEIATDSEVATGTSETLAVNPKQLATKQATITGAATTIVSSDLTASKAVISNASGKIDVSDTTSTELGYVHGVTSAIQTQIDNKVTKNADITAGTATKITYDAKGLVTAGTTLSASDIPDISADYVSTDLLGVADGVATLDSNGKVPTSQLPSFVDDVIDSYIVSGATELTAGWLSKTSGGAALTPETDKIYVIVESGPYQNKTYRWSGSTYVEISAAPGQATESTAGIAAIATQQECTTGTNDTKFVTPLKMATYVAGMSKKLTATNSSLTPTSGVCTWSITNTLNTADVIVSVYEVSTGNEVFADITAASGAITIKINSTSNIAANTYKAVILG